MFRGTHNGEERKTVVPPVLLLQEDSNTHVDESAPRSRGRHTLSNSPSRYHCHYWTLQTTGDPQQCHL